MPSEHGVAALNYDGEPRCSRNTRPGVATVAVLHSNCLFGESLKIGFDMRHPGSETESTVLHRTVPQGHRLFRGLCCDCTDFAGFSFVSAHSRCDGEAVPAKRSPK